jgi:hypothetical protein
MVVAGSRPARERALAEGSRPRGAFLGDTSHRQGQRSVSAIARKVQRVGGECA